MSSDDTRDPQNGISTTFDSRLITPIRFYVQTIVFALGMAAVAYLYPIVLLPNFRYMLEFWGVRPETIASLISLLAKLSTPFALLFGWGLGGLYVCGWLAVWLKRATPWRVGAIVLTAVLAILWLVSILRFVEGKALPEVLAYSFQAFGIPPKVASTLILLGLTVGVPVLPLLWVIRPLEGFLARFLSILWLLMWLFFVAMGEFRAALVLLVSTIATGAVLLVGLRLTSDYLLPIPRPDRETRRKVLDLLRDHIMGVNYPAYIVTDEPYEEDKVEERIPGDKLSRLAIGPGLILSDCDHAVAVFDGFKFKGVHGPGVIFTKYGDRILQTIDLRPQFRGFMVEALTKDGIKVKVPAAIAIQVDPHDKTPKLGEPLPYSKSAAFKALHAQRVEHQGDEPQKSEWASLAREIAERVLQDIISTYRFDDLYGPYQPGGDPPRKAISAKFSAQTAAELEPLGIHLIGGGLNNIQPADSAVYLKRASSWQADWMRKTMLKQAEGQAEWLRTVERARADAQVDLILRLGRQLEELSAKGGELNPEATLRLLVSVLEGLVSQQPSLGQLLPEETMRALVDIRSVIHD